MSLRILECVCRSVRVDFKGQLACQSAQVPTSYLVDLFVAGCASEPCLVGPVHAVTHVRHVALTAPAARQGRAGPGRGQVWSDRVREGEAGSGSNRAAGSRHMPPTLASTR